MEKIKSKKDIQNIKFSIDKHYWNTEILILFKFLYPSCFKLSKKNGV